MKIKELPFSVILELCSYLDNPTLPHQSWRGLLAKAPGEGERETEGGREGEKERGIEISWQNFAWKLRFLNLFVSM